MSERLNQLSENIFRAAWEGQEKARRNDGKNQPDALPPSPVRGGIFAETTGPNQPKPRPGRHHPDDAAPPELGKFLMVAVLQRCRAYGAGG